MFPTFCRSYDDGSVRPPDQQFIKRLYEDFKSWEGALNEEAELFTGETLLAREEELHQMNKEVDCWTDVAVKVRTINQSINFIYPRIYRVALKC